MLKHSYLHPIDEDKLHGNIIAKTIKNIYKLIIQIKHEIYLKFFFTRICSVTNIQHINLVNEKIIRIE